MRTSAIFVLLAACSTHPSPTAGQLTALKLSLTSPDPASIGNPSNPITARSATFDVAAFTDQGKPYSGDATLNVYISFGGVKTGAVSLCGSDDPAAMPISTVALSGGVAHGVTIDLPQAFGAT